LSDTLLADFDATVVYDISPAIPDGPFDDVTAAKAGLRRDASDGAAIIPAAAVPSAAIPAATAAMAVIAAGLFPGIAIIVPVGGAGWRQAQSARQNGQSEYFSRVKGHRRLHSLEAPASGGLTVGE
jgi:hypothetical protein